MYKTKNFCKDKHEGQKRKFDKINQRRKKKESFLELAEIMSEFLTKLIF